MRASDPKRGCIIAKEDISWWGGDSHNRNAWARLLWWDLRMGVGDGSQNEGRDSKGL